MRARTLNPFVALGELQREMNRLFEGYGPRLNGGPWTRATTFPALNIWEDGDVLHAEAEIPGVSQEDIEIYAVGNELTIKGTRKPGKGEEAYYHRRERGIGEFTRTITLPVEIDTEKVQASLKDGVLSVTLPKAEEAKPKKISVKTQ